MNDPVFSSQGAVPTLVVPVGKHLIERGKGGGGGRCNNLMRRMNKKSEMMQSGM